MADLKTVNRARLVIRRARGCIVFGAVLLVGVGALASPVLAQAAPSWQPIPGGGCIMRLAGGDSSAQGALNAYRVRFPADYQRDSGVHYHLDTRHIVVLAGTLVIGFGDTVDVRNTKSYGAGSFFAIPARAHHFEWFKGAIEAHVEAVGPDETIWITHAANYAKKNPARTPGAAGC
jgi:hypothetical protein